MRRTDSKYSRNTGFNLFHSSRNVCYRKKMMEISNCGTIISINQLGASFDTKGDQYRSDSDNDPGDGTVSDFSCVLSRFIQGKNPKGDCNNG